MFNPVALGPFIFIPLGLLLILIYAGIREGSRRMHRYGLAVMFARWLTGGYHHGDALTNATWTQHGTRPLTRNGHASRFAHQPRLHRALWRTGATLFLIYFTYGYFTNKAMTMFVLKMGGLMAIAGFAIFLIATWDKRVHHHRFVRPLHRTVAPMLGYARNMAPAYITHPVDRSHVQIDLPEGWKGTDTEKKALKDVVQRKLVWDATKAEWFLSGSSPYATFTPNPPPPDKVPSGMLGPQFAKAKKDELVLGMGRGDEWITTSLKEHSPHIGLSVPTTFGKSVTSRLIAAQVLNQGGVVLILDIKWLSQSWAIGLPNVVYARTPAEIHEALIWLSGEVSRRNEKAHGHVDFENNVNASVGDRILVIVEELNVTQNRLLNYWRDIRKTKDPQRSPAARALDDILFMGRQVHINVLAVAQRLSARASGTGDARENMSTRIIGGKYTSATWKMLCPEFVMPPPSMIPGRMQVVTDKVKDVQIGFLTGDEAHKLALSGTVAELPVGMAEAVARVHVGPGGAPEATPVALAPEALSLRAAVDLHIIGPTLAAVRMARHRDPNFPKPLNPGSTGTHVWDPQELRDYMEGRKRK